MTGYTPGDNLPYPDDYAQPADTPNALEDLATAVQTALTKRMNILPSVTAIPLAAGWFGAAGNIPTALRYGELVLCRGLAHRSTALTVADNGLYPLGTVPAGYRPATFGRYPVPLVMHPSTGGVNWSVTSLDLSTAGALEIIANQAGQLAANDWVSFAGLGWVTR